MFEGHSTFINIPLPVIVRVRKCSACSRQQIHQTNCVCIADEAGRPPQPRSERASAASDPNSPRVSVFSSIQIYSSPFLPLLSSCCYLLCFPSEKPPPSTWHCSTHTQDARSTRLSHDMCGCFTLPQNGDGNIQARDCHREGAGRNKDQCGV